MPKKNGKLDAQPQGLQGFDKEDQKLIETALSAPVSSIKLKAALDEDSFEEANFDRSRFPGQIKHDAKKAQYLLNLDVLFALIPENVAEEVIEPLHQQLKPRGIQALVTANDTKDYCYIFELGVNPAREKYEGKAMIVFLKAKDATPLIWLRQTSGSNYDVSTVDIVGKLDEWAKKCSFEVIGAGVDWVHIKFDTLPRNLKKFAEEVYEFCPDVIDQAIVKEYPENYDELSQQKRLDFISEAIDSQDTDDLAEFIKREKRLFLWWD